MVLVGVNPAAEAMSPSAAAFIGRGAAEIALPGMVRALMQATAADGETRDTRASYESPLSRINYEGTFRVVAVPTGVLLFIDPPSHSSGEFSLPPSIETLRQRLGGAMLRGALAAAYVWHVQPDGDLTLADFNEAAVRATKGAVADLLGLRAQSLYWDQPVFIEFLERARDEGSAEHDELPLRYVTTGEVFYFRARAIREGDHVAVFAEDRSQELAMARDLREAEARLRQVEQLDALGRLAGGIAHDFNNLLAALQTTVDLLRERAPRDLEPDLDLLREMGHRGAQLTERLLAFGRPSEVQPRAVALQETLGAYLEQRPARPRVEVDLVVQPDLGPVFVDPRRLLEALEQLLTNAEEAMPEGGHIVVSAERADGVERAAYPRDLKGAMAVIRVSDEGVGIPPASLPVLFEPFVSTHTGGRSRGLGLSIVMSVAREAGGDARARSLLGKGSTFSLALPLAEKRPGTRGRPRAVLLVEDDAMLRSVLARLLQVERFEVTTASNGLEALEELRRKNFDVVVSDLVMPELGGTELARRAREVQPQLPFVFCSGHYDENPLATIGPPAVLLRKPLGRKELADAIRTVADTEGDALPG
tara:strand:+ start:455 stop:2230 length:1776 start_codon:yes stop_codon:yes gene_type:complete